MTEENEADEEETTSTEETEEVEGSDEQESTEEESEETQEVEPWMQKDEEEAEESEEGDGEKPKKLTTKQKLRRKVEERDTELEALRKENAQLKGGAQQVPGDVKRPSRDDFDDDAGYDDAFEKYILTKTEATVTERETTRTSQAEQERVKTERREAVEEHLIRAETLINDPKWGMTAETYEKADKLVRDAFTKVQGDRGDATVDQLIDILGPGSEKTMWYLGRNKGALTQTIELLKKDPYKLVAFLSGKQKEFEGAKSKTSRARKPAANVHGNDTPAKEGAFKKKYDAAHKAGNAQDAFNIKGQARAEGVDTKAW